MTAAHQAALSLGANLGDRVTALRRAVDALARVPGTSVASVSSLYETLPVGGPAQPAFLNAVVVLDIGPGQSLSDLAEKLLAVAQQAESDLGRRREVRWGPRTLDVDVLAVGDLVSSDERLTVPHPRIRERAFVLVPWAEVADSFVVQGLGRVAELVSGLPRDSMSGVRRVEDRTAAWWTSPTLTPG